MCYGSRLALPPFFLSITSMSTWFGSGLIFATGVVYGMMALGKKYVPLYKIYNIITKLSLTVVSKLINNVL